MPRGASGVGGGVQECGCGCGSVTVGDSQATQTCGCGCGSEAHTKTAEEEIAELTALRESIDRRLGQLAS